MNYRAVGTPTEYPCDKYELVVTSKLSLILHRKALSHREPLCDLSTENIKHMYIHKQTQKKHMHAINLHSTLNNTKYIHLV